MKYSYWRLLESYLAVIMLSTVCLNAHSLNNHEAKDNKASHQRGISNEFKSYEKITPILYSKSGNLLNSTLFHNGGHVSEFSIFINAFGEELRLDLTRNEKLFGNEYVEKVVVGKNEFKRFSRFPSSSTESHCYYHGIIRGKAKTSVALSSCHGLRGVISSELEDYYVEPLDILSGLHLIYKEFRHKQLNFTCGHIDEDIHRIQTSIEKGLKSQFKGSNQEFIPKKIKLKRSMNEPSRKPELIAPRFNKKPLRVVELYVVTDTGEYHAMEGSEYKLIQRVKDIINIVSSIYQLLDIYVVLVGLEMWTVRNLIDISGNPDDTMNAFIEYRRNYINPHHRNDNAQLIIGRDLGEGILGKAPIMTICTHQYSGGVSADRSVSLAPIATTVAHEMGHNFGMGHDDGDCHCPDDRCIMSSSGSGRRSPTRWSDCSRMKMEDAIHQGMDYCLHDLPERLYRGSSCGNGFTEQGEECDCGLEADCTNNCCDARTCTLKTNATCASGWCCDLSTCQPKSAGTACRFADGTCDLAEYCNGVSEHCPSDAYVIDGTECSVRQKKAYCYKGKCNTIDDQCRLLWGRTGEESHALCFKHFNIMGNGNGHCGFNWVDRTFQKCSPEDVMCGMIHCRHRSEKLMFWKEALVFTLPDTYVTVNGQREDCKAAILDVGLNMPDPSLALDGVKCGDGKMCVSHRCTKIENVERIPCGDCNNHGVCNNLGQCHCNVGYAPPDCITTGFGGSEHSGPASSSLINTALAITLSVLVIVLVILTAVIVHVLHKRHDRLKRFIVRKWSIRIHKYSSVSRSASSAKPPDRSMAKEPTDIQVTIKGTSQVKPSLAKSTAKPVTKVARAASMSAKIGRNISFRPEDISNPTLQSSTNDLVEHLPSIEHLSSDSIFDAQSSTANLLTGVHATRNRLGSIQRSTSSAARLVHSAAGEPVLFDKFQANSSSPRQGVAGSDLSNRLKKQVNVKESLDSVQTNSCDSLGDENVRPLLKGKQNLHSLETKVLPSVVKAMESVDKFKEKGKVDTKLEAKCVNTSDTKKPSGILFSQAKTSLNNFLSNQTGKNVTTTKENSDKANAKIEASVCKSSGKNGDLLQNDIAKLDECSPVDNSVSNMVKEENTSEMAHKLKPTNPSNLFEKNEVVSTLKPTNLSKSVVENSFANKNTTPHPNQSAKSGQQLVSNNTFTAREKSRPPPLRNNTFTAPLKHSLKQKSQYISAPNKDSSSTNDSNISIKESASTNSLHNSKVRALINKVEPKLTTKSSSQGNVAEKDVPERSDSLSDDSTICTFAASDSNGAKTVSRAIHSPSQSRTNVARNPSVKPPVPPKPN